MVHVSQILICVLLFTFASTFGTVGEQTEKSFQEKAVIWRKLSFVRNLGASLQDILIIEISIFKQTPI